MASSADPDTLYARIRVIGRGSYGEVWLVKHKKDKKQVCVNQTWGQIHLYLKVFKYFFSICILHLGIESI